MIPFFQTGFFAPFNQKLVLHNKATFSNFYVKTVCMLFLIQVPPNDILLTTSICMNIIFIAHERLSTVQRMLDLAIKKYNHENNNSDCFLMELHLNVWHINVH